MTTIMKYNALRAQAQQVELAQDAPLDATAFKRMQGGGNLLAATFYYEVRPGAGESIVVSVGRNRAGVSTSVLTANLTIDNASPVGPATATIALDPAKLAFLDGDFFEINFDYTAGGTPAPMTVQRALLTTTPG